MCEMPPVIERWQRAGGGWRIAQVAANVATVELLRCDGGEVVDLVTLHATDEVSWARHVAAGPRD